MNMKQNLYMIDDDYIEKLKKVAPYVYDNKEETFHKRKYLGPIYLNHIPYYIPLSSPKKNDFYDYDSTMIKRSILPIERIVVKETLYGTLRLSNMIPVPKEKTRLYHVWKEIDVLYQDVILKEMSYLYKNQSRIIKHATVLYDQKMKNISSPYLSNCIDFSKVEEVYQKEK